MRGRQLARHRDDLGDLLRRENGADDPRAALQPVQALSAEPSSPAADAVGMAIRACGDLDIGHPLGRVEDHPRALHLTPRRRRLTRATLELVALVSAQLDPAAAAPGTNHSSPHRTSLLHITRKTSGRVY
jgi:hypothetical protein